MINEDYEIFNPNNRPIAELPVIYGFNNGGSRGWYSAYAIAEDGLVLGSHICSDEGFMRYDLGVFVGTRKDRHENQYQKHYPNGYRMDFVPSDEIKTHVELNKAFELNKQQVPEEEVE